MCSLSHLSMCFLLDFSVLRNGGGKERNLERLIPEKATLGQLIDFPPSLTHRAAPLYLAFPFWLLNRALMNPLPTDPAASHSQSALSLSISSTARQKISPEARGGGTRHILLQPAPEKEKRTVTRYE